MAFGTQKGHFRIQRLHFPKCKLLVGTTHSETVETGCQESHGRRIQLVVKIELFKVRREF